VGGVGALPAAATEQAALEQPGQQRVEDRRLQTAGDQPGAELAEHREVEALIAERQPQAVLPVQPAADRVGGLPVGEVLSELQDGHHR
jgi:hypothetical protein